MTEHSEVAGELVLTRQVLQTALEVEMAQNLGYDRYDRYDRAGRGSPNSRNGTSPKTVRTEIGEVTIAVPRDRAGTFEPQIVPKHQRRLAGFDEAVISLYAKGMTPATSPPTSRRSTTPRSPATWSAASPSRSWRTCAPGSPARWTRSTR